MDCHIGMAGSIKYRLSVTNMVLVVTGIVTDRQSVRFC